MKLLIVIILFCPLLGIAQAKSKIDSIVIEFLTKQPNTPKPSLKIAGDKKGTISRNYFLQPNNPIIKDSIKIATYLFGSGASHSCSYLLTEVTRGIKKEYHITESNTIEEAIRDLLEYIKPFSLSNSQKALLVNQVTVAYY